jgi:hypothetical protein
MTHQNYTLNTTDASYLTDKNYQSMVNYIDNLFERRSRLLVMRLDLSYRKDIDTPFLNEVEIYHSYCQAKADREHLFRNMRSNSIFDEMIGYIWKLEYGKEKGFHYHFIFFKNSEDKQDITIARRIGEYWANVITQGRGLYYNCNADKGKYRYLGIGTIDRSHTDSITNLKHKVVPYLVKPDENLRVLRIDIDRTFGRGEMQEKTETRGRPRTSKQPNPIPLDMGLNPQLNLNGFNNLLAK